MRKLLALLVTLTLIFAWTLSSVGEPVSSNIAVELGKAHLKTEGRYWKSRTSARRRSARTVRGYSVSETREFRVDGRLLAYILDLEPEGCIIVSPDTDIYPVIAYSPAGRFSMIDTEENIFLHLVKWDMQNRLDALSSSSKILKAKNNTQWRKYLSDGGSSTQAVVSSAVWGPWLKTTWSQGIAHRRQGFIYPDYDYGDYNRYLPIGHSSEWRCVTGCGPLAMAQVANYWKYPSSLSLDQGDEYTSSMSYSINGQPYNLTVEIDDDHNTYDFPSFAELNSKLSYIRYYDGDLYFWDSQIWDYRSPVDEDSSLSAADKQEIKEDIAALCFACATLFQADYSPVGTSASVSYFPNSTKDFSPFIDKFGYSSAIVADVDWPQFYSTLEADMKVAHPAMLLVDSQSGGQGHFIVADGYRDEWDGGSQGYYHLNFGWGGANPDSVAESWYHLPDGMPQPSGLNQYNVVKLGVLNIYPPQQQQQNTPPVASNPTITPGFPLTIDDLVGSYDYSDADGDQESGSRIRWYVNGFIQPDYNDQDTIPAANTSSGQTWYFKVTPGDGTDMGESVTSNSVTIEDQIQEREIQLYSGWNFISIYLDIGYIDLLSVLDQIKNYCTSVRAYNAATGEWETFVFGSPQFLNDLNTIEIGRGYWLNMTDSASLNLTGERISNTAIQLFPGMNIVGYNLTMAKSCEEALSSIEGNCIAVWSYDNETEIWSRYMPNGAPASNTLAQLEPGNAYIIEVNAGCVWTVSP